MAAKQFWTHRDTPGAIIILYLIVNNVDQHYKVYSDLSGMEAPGGGTIPLALCVTRLKQDIGIVDTHTKNPANGRH